MPLINLEINLILTWSAGYVTSSVAGKRTISITDTKLYIPIVISSTQDNSKLSQQLKSGLKRTISWNKYQSKVSTER